MYLSKRTSLTIFFVLSTFYIFNNQTRLFTQIITEPSIGFLLHEMQSLDTNSLVIFDLDDTLIQGISYAPDDIKLGIRKTWYLINKILEKANTETQKALIYKKLFKMKPNLVEPNAPDIIKELQKKGIKTIGLTASFAGLHGTHGRVPCNADMRVAHLGLLDINFSKAFPTTAPMVFDQLELDGEKPAFVHGILFSRPQEKGIVLEAFLQSINWKPNKIIFIDNLRAMVENVALSCQKLEIPYLGIEFTGARTLPPLDPALFQAQVQYLMLHDRWLDYHEIFNVLNNNQYCSI